MSLKDSCEDGWLTYPPTFPSVNHFDCKGNELFWIEQENSQFLVNFLRKLVNFFRKGDFL